MSMLQGVAISQGIAIGHAVVLQSSKIEVGKFSIPKPMVSEEVARYKDALKKTRRQFKDIRKKILVDSSSEIAAFIDAHILMLKDAVFATDPIEIIKEQCVNAEWALKLKCDETIAIFEAMDDPYLRARRDDVEHVVDKILRNLLDSDGLLAGMQQQLKGAVVVADDVSPADLLVLQQQGVLALSCKSGGENSHTAILVRGLGLPAVFGVHDLDLQTIGHHTLVVDGYAGQVHDTPSLELLDEYRARQNQERQEKAELNALIKLPAETRDGCVVTLSANIDLPGDVANVRKVCAQGVGLYRTEMLFMNHKEPVSEEVQFAVYRQITESLAGEVLTIRTLDIGADKAMFGVGQQGSPLNPALGLRAVRWYLKESSVFRSQVRAILRASHYGAVRMMLPMLTTLAEVSALRDIIEEEKAGLRDAGIAFDEAMLIGGMIEVPAAALQAEAFARRLDFLSIGTNDLIQYTLAADRMDDEVGYLCDPLHPAIIRLIAMILDAGRKCNVPVSMCGEMAGNIRYTRLLIGLGLRDFSMAPAAVLAVKKNISLSDSGELSVKVKQLALLDDADEIARFVDNMNLNP